MLNYIELNINKKFIDKKCICCCSIIFFAPSVIATRIITDVIPITIPSEVNIVLGTFLKRFVFASKILSMIYESFIS